MGTKNDKEFLDAMSRNTAYWRGPFYFNRKDPRLMVPKLQPSMGWTLNLSNPLAWITLVALVGIVIAVTVFSI
jgi:uncharacterized membrane protein